LATVLEITYRFLLTTASVISHSGVFNLSVRCPKSRFTEPILTLQGNIILLTAIQRQKVARKTQRLFTSNHGVPSNSNKKTEF
jgi:hypothetical protein